MLHELEDANAFVTSLDARRFWFRYHHLFADLVQMELRRAAPAELASLHRAAAKWHEEQGFVIEAIRHAQAARDWRLASRLLADHHIDLTFDGRAGSVAQLLSAFPDDVAGGDAELAVVFATARLLDGSLERSAAFLDLARRLADAVTPERRPAFDLLLAEVSLGLARWRGDLATVVETRPLVDAALAAQPPGERTLNDEIRAVALLNLGIAELWSSRLVDAGRDLEQALALARRAGRPWLEIACLGHLGIAGPLTGSSLSAGLELSEKAVKIADDHGWSEDPIVVCGLAVSAMALLWLGRLGEAERWLERAERTLQPDGEPGTELIVHQARGLLCLSQGRLEDALAALRAAERMQAMLAGTHVFSAAVRARLLQTQAYMGRLPAARAALAEINGAQRDTGDMRLATAVLDLAEGEADRATCVIAPVIDGWAPVIHRPSATTEAYVLDALAREQLGDRQAAEASLERALDAAEPEGIVLPFVLMPVRDLLESLPRTAPRIPRFGKPSSTCSKVKRPGQRGRPASRSMSSVKRSCVSCATYPATCARRRSPLSCLSRRTPSGPICATSTPS